MRHKEVPPPKIGKHGQSQRRLRVELEYIRLVEDYWENGRSKRWRDRALR